MACLCRRRFLRGSAALAGLAVAHRLPSVHNGLGYPRLGGLMAYGVSRPETYRRAATYVDRILNGARPGDLPMERPRKFELVLNLRTAHVLGLTIPPAILLSPDTIVIE